MKIEIYPNVKQFFSTSFSSRSDDMSRFVICKINDSTRACGTLVYINMGHEITRNLGSFSGENCSRQKILVSKHDEMVCNVVAPELGDLSSYERLKGTYQTPTIN